jgi:phosphopantothenoylcysteine synthetase/decarboxylase
VSRVLYVIICAAPPARDVAKIVVPAQERGWDVCVIATPQAQRFVDVPVIEELTGHPVRSEYKEPGAPDVLPPPDAIAVAPATFNTINKWAAGISDTLALGLLTEAIGKRLTVVALPFTNRLHAAHPAFADNIARLRSWGVTVLYGPDIYPLHDPGTGSQHLDAYPWHLVLGALDP